MKSFVNPFVDIILAFFDSLFNSFDVTFLTWLLKICLFEQLTKWAILLLLAKFACLNLAVKFSAVNLLNSGVVICLSVIIFPISLLLCYNLSFWLNY